MKRDSDVAVVPSNEDVLSNWIKESNEKEYACFAWVEGYVYIMGLYYVSTAIDNKWKYCLFDSPNAHKVLRELISKGLEIGPVWLNGMDGAGDLT